MDKTKTEKVGNLKDNFQKIAEINNWFEKQDEVDIEEGLKKIKEAIKLIKVSKDRLKSIENEFEEIKRGAQT